jgi:colanic acid/amylovoran biosynthesis glycosyltransferase
MRKNVALISPNKNAFSETFIQAHRLINANVFYYFGGFIPSYIEFGGIKSVIRIWNFSKVLNLFKRKFFNFPLNVREEQLLKSFIHHEIDIVFAEFGQTGAALLNVCKYGKIPLVAMFHGADISVNKIVEEYKERYLSLFNYSKKIIVVSQYMENRIVSMGCDADKIVYTPCAPNDRFFDLKPQFTENRTFFAIGRFVDKKAPYYSILAVKRVAELYPDVKLYIGGDGPLMNVCLNLIRYYNLEKNIFLLGVVDHQVCEEILKKALAFVQHSVTALDGDMEGTPVAVLEASACGLPVISTRHAGIAEVIVDGETGFLVNEHDVDEMAAKMIYLIENPEIARKIGENGKRRVRDNFSMKNHLSVIENALLSSLN